MTEFEGDPFAGDLATQRREARERVIEMLYEADFKEGNISDVIESQIVVPDAFAIRLAIGVYENISNLDQQIEALLHEGWSLERLGKLDRWILRLGIYEMNNAEVPAAVIINEAVELAHQYGATDESGKFVNGLLAAQVNQQ